MNVAERCGSRPLGETRPPPRSPGSTSPSLPPPRRAARQPPAAGAIASNASAAAPPASAEPRLWQPARRPSSCPADAPAAGALPAAAGASGLLPFAAEDRLAPVGSCSSRCDNSQYPPAPAVVPKLGVSVDSCSSRHDNSQYPPAPAVVPKLRVSVDSCSSWHDNSHYPPAPAVVPKLRVSVDSCSSRHDNSHYPPAPAVVPKLGVSVDSCSSWHDNSHYPPAPAVVPKLGVSVDSCSSWHDNSHYPPAPAVVPKLLASERQASASAVSTSALRHRLRMEVRGPRRSPSYLSDLYQNMLRAEAAPGRGQQQPQAVRTSSSVTLLSSIPAKGGSPPNQPQSSTATSCDPALRPIIRRRARSLPTSPERRKRAGVQCQVAGCEGRMNRVRFADALGLELTEVKVFQTGEDPSIPLHVLSRLSINSDLWGSSLDLEFTMQCLVPDFQQPADCLDFSARLQEQQLCSVVQFAARYQVNGQEYWDNNRGKNYSFTCRNYPLKMPRECEESWIHFI
ncbi:protein phosphatase 1 regulatory subunit 3D [Apteryx rowi]|uniref:protein phosphatase 1 regulatory subunit 3D n=1 Tax=Apteryx rowi TaxID=308060 RepID=UPI000E1D5C20|nr:protein phosphatase 1 regulatory subunit 3D [Apteryx rowi]